MLAEVEGGSLAIWGLQPAELIRRTCKIIAIRVGQIFPKVQRIIPPGLYFHLLIPRRVLGFLCVCLAGIVSDAIVAPPERVHVVVVFECPVPFLEPRTRFSCHRQVLRLPSCCFVSRASVGHER